MNNVSDYRERRIREYISQFISNCEDGDDIMLILIECMNDTLKRMTILNQDCDSTLYINKKANTYSELCSDRLKSTCTDFI